MQLQTILKFIHTVDWHQKCFSNWTDSQIGRAIVDGIEDNAFVLDLNPNNTINGLVLGWPSHKDKLLHITAILIKEKRSETLKRFIEQYNKVFPGYTIEALRKGKLRTYPTARLLSKLNNLTSG